MRAALLAALLLLLPLGASRADDPNAAEPLRQRTLRLLEALGVRDATGPSLNARLEVMSRAYPNVPHDFWRAQYQRHVDAQLLMNGLAEVVERRFNAEEIDALLDFYTSSVGKRVIDLRIELAKAAKTLGQQLGEAFQLDVRRALQEGGYLE